MPITARSILLTVTLPLLRQKQLKIVPIWNYVNGSSLNITNYVSFWVCWSMFYFNKTFPAWFSFIIVINVCLFIINESLTLGSKDVLQNYKLMYVHHYICASKYVWWYFIDVYLFTHSTIMNTFTYGVKAECTWSGREVDPVSHNKYTNFSFDGSRFAHIPWVSPRVSTLRFSHKTSTWIYTRVTSMNTFELFSICRTHYIIYTTKSYKVHVHFIVFKIAHGRSLWISCHTLNSVQFIFAGNATILVILVQSHKRIHYDLAHIHI